jgi:8-amino-7-oxononanoate synthase
MNRTRLQDRVDAQRLEREALGRRRTRRAVTRRDGVGCEVDGRWLLDFCGNDYLGMAQHFAVVDALQDSAARHGAGGVASHLVSGHHAAHEALERELADWLEVPAALVFGSGYAANLAVVQSLMGDGDVCVQDKLNHASLIDAARLAGCRLRRYPHADAEGAIRQLRAHPEGSAMIATDGVFSMDGDVAPLRQLALVARAQDALLYVDDAHGIGVLGPDGRGSVAAAHLGVSDAPLRLATFGKALGSHGAAVCGDAALVRHIAETGRPYIYTTAMPAAQAAATLAAVRLARREQWRRDKLQESIAHFRAGAHRRGLPLLPSDTPIQPLLVGDDRAAVAMAQALEARGFWVAAIRPPTVPEGTARLRITLTAGHDRLQIDALLHALDEARGQLQPRAATAPA